MKEKENVQMVILKVWRKENNSGPKYMENRRVLRRLKEDWKKQEVAGFVEPDFKIKNISRNFLFRLRESNSNKYH